jgi:voltage-gated potassium channel
VALVILAPPFLVPTAVQGVRSLRLLRTLRFLRVLRALSIAAIGIKIGSQALQRSKFHYVLLVAAATVALGTVGIYVIEHGANPGIRTFDDALWWAVVTATTVGYGDVSPVTGEGRVIAVLLMLVGIGVIGIFTASLAGWLFERGDDDRQAQVEARLMAIEDKLDSLLRRLGSP